MDSDRSSGFLEDALVDGITTPRSSISNKANSLIENPRRCELGSSSRNNLHQELAPANNQIENIESLVTAENYNNNNNNNNIPLSLNSSSSVKPSEPDALEYEWDMARIGDSTETNPITLTGTLPIDDGNNAFQEENYVVNHDAQIGNNNNAMSHQSRTLLWPTLSESVQHNYAPARPTPGYYGEQLRSMAGNNWPQTRPTHILDPNLNRLFQQPTLPFPGYQPFPLRNPPLLGSHTLNTQLPIFSVGMSSGVIQPNRQNNEHHGQQIGSYQNAYNNQQNNNLPHPPIEQFSLSGIINHQNGGENMANHNYGLTCNNNQQPNVTQNVFPPHNSIMNSAEMGLSQLNLSNLSFTQLLAASDLMTSPFAEYWIKRQLTDNLQAHHILNRFVPPANNNYAVYNPNSVSLRSPNVSSSNQALPHHNNHPRPDNPMVGHYSPHSLRVPHDFNGVPRRRRSHVQRPAILSGSQLGLRLMRSASASSEVSDADAVNSFPQVGGTRSNRVVIGDRTNNSGGQMVDPVPICLPLSGHRRVDSRESSASSSKRPRREVLATSPEPIVSQMPRPNASWYSQSEENSNDVDQHSDASSIESDSETRNKKKGHKK